MSSYDFYWAFLDESDNYESSNSSGIYDIMTLALFPPLEESLKKKVDYSFAISLYYDGD